MSSDTEVKVARLMKRSQNRHFYTRENYKQRIFVLARRNLHYYEISSGDNRGREKGRISLSLVRLVEYVNDDHLDSKKNVFQVCYTEEKSAPEKLFLYVVCSTPEEREEWVRSIRMLANERGARFQFHFHPGVWLRRISRYTCCQDIDRNCNGCQRTTPPPSTGAVPTPAGPAQPPAFDQAQPRRRSSASSVTLDESPREPAPARQRLDGVIGVLRQHQQQQQQTVPQQQPPPPPPHKTLQSAQTPSGLGNSVVPLQPSGRINNGQLAPTGGLTPTGAAVGMSVAENITVTALHSFTPQREGQLKLNRGERYFVLNSDNPQWWYVRNTVGAVGYVPANHLQIPNGLSTFDIGMRRFLSCDGADRKLAPKPSRLRRLYSCEESPPSSDTGQSWYYNDLTRQQAESILLDENREGCFLVRDSLTKKNAFTLSVTSKNPESGAKLKVHHYHIHYDEAARQYFLSEKYRFPTVNDVIHYHRHNSGGLVVRLRFPPLKDRESSMLAGLGLDAFEIDPAELIIEKEIGKGQFGVVLLGSFRGNPVAVKQMVEGAMNESDFIEEAKNMRFLNHPNLVLLYGVVLRSRPVMIITEYMKHGSLRDFLRQRHSTYSKRPVVLADISAQVAKGMAYLEQCKFVHRDLAARNCLVKSVSRRSVQVKVADFGMTRFLLDNVYEPSAGTKFPVRWAPPEVFQSSYTIKSDVWSFGVLMWEVFTCSMETPYHNMNNTQVYQFIVGGGRLTKPAICPDRMYVLMLECWRYDPEGRPNFEYVCQCLNDYLDLNYDN